MDVAVKWVYQEVHRKGHRMEAGQKPALCFKFNKHMLCVAAGYPVRVLKRAAQDFDKARAVVHNGQPEYPIAQAVATLAELGEKNGITEAARKLLQRAQGAVNDTVDDEDSFSDEEDITVEKPGEAGVVEDSNVAATAPDEATETKDQGDTSMQTGTSSSAGKKPNGAIVKAAAKKAAAAAKKASSTPKKPRAKKAAGDKPALRDGSVAQKAYTFWCKELGDYKKLEDVPRGELRKVGEKISSKFGIKSGVNYSYFFAKTYGITKN